VSDSGSPGPALSGAGRLLVEAAQAEAAGLGHGFVGLEHLLLALLADPGLADRAAPGATLPSREAIRAKLAGRPGPKSLTGAGEHGLSPQARRLLEAAERKAQEEGGGSPDRVWILQRILRQSRGPLARLLGGREARDAAPLEEAASPKGTRGPQGGRQRRTPERPAAPSPIRPTPPPPKIRIQPRSRRPSWRGIMLLAVPASIALNMAGAAPLVVFLTTCAAVIPLAGYMGEATEHLAARTGPAVGGLLNATFGNAAELIIAMVALRAGYVELVKASITGSILGNLLLIMGLSFVAGGHGRQTFRFSRVSAGANAGMLALAVVGLVFPALFHRLHPEAGAPVELSLSETVAVVLAVTYAFSLLFSLRTHKSLFSGDPYPTSPSAWRPGVALLVLGLATAGVVVQSEILVHSVEGVTSTLGLSETFLGLIIVPIIGNAAEHATAVVVARKGQIDLSLQIALGSSTQVALLVAPLLVLAGVLMGQPMDLVFTAFEVAAVGLTTIITAIITLDGESHWFEGVQLLATYALVAATAFFL